MNEIEINPKKQKKNRIKPSIERNFFRIEESGTTSYLSPKTD